MHCLGNSRWRVFFSSSLFFLSPAPPLFFLFSLISPLLFLFSFSPPLLLCFLFLLSPSSFFSPFFPPSLFSLHVLLHHFNATTSASLVVLIQYFKCCVHVQYLSPKLFQCIDSHRITHTVYNNIKELFRKLNL